MAKKKTNGSQVLALSVLGLVVGFAAGAFGAHVLSKPDSYEIPAKIPANNDLSGVVGTDFTVETITNNEFSIHFMELGNKYTGDSSLVKAGDVEVLIDAGSKSSSVEAIYNYTSQYVEGKLDYIIVTHAHEDHYAGFATNRYEDSLFAKYSVGEGTTIIDFAQTTASKKSNKMYLNYTSNLQTAINNGATHYTCKDLAGSTINLSSSVSMEILKTKFYDTVSTTENNHSVCTLFKNGSHNYLLTGDLEKEGEISLVNLNTLPEVDVYKAGHHGSKTSSSSELMEVIKPKEVCVCCCAGSSEYTKTNVNQFPTQEFVNNVAPYTDLIYVTSLCEDYEKGLFSSMNGNIIVCSNNGNATTTYCSNNTTKLKDTDWFKANRTWPQ